MRPSTRLAAAGVLLAWPARADAEDASRRRDVEVAASLGYGVPVASAEHGARLGDTAIGTVPIAIDVSYRLTRALGLAAYVRYGVGIPTLCQSAGACTSSLGSDVAVALRARFFLPRFGPTQPYADIGPGYEWFSSTLSDAGAGSTRAYRGPVLLSAEIAAPFRLSPRVSLGPSVGGSVGTFTQYRLDANAASARGSVPARALHGWLSLAARVSVRF